MVEFKASKHTIPNRYPSSSSSSSPSSSSSSFLSQPHTLSLLYEPNSLSLALFHSDSSFSLYSPFSLHSLPSPLLSPQTIIPPPSSSSTFLLLHRQNPNNSDPPHVLFIVSGPHKGGSQILLRFHILDRSKSNWFVRARVVCNQKGLSFDPDLGVLVNSHHGFSVRISGSVNFFAMYSVSNAKVWVFAVKVLSDEGSGDDGFVMKLMKCGVIECCRPLYSIRVSFGLLVLGEENGVRVVDLRSFVKGSVRKVKNLNVKGGGRSSRIPNGVINDGVVGSLENGYGDGYLEGKLSKRSASGKQRFVKLKQESHGGDICFVVLKGEDVTGSKSKTMATLSRKAISIQPLSPNKFLVLDSAGDLYLLCLPKSGPLTGADVDIQLKQLPHIMKVQKLAYTPDDIMGAQAVWISDGCHSMHMITGYDTDAANDESNAKESEKNHIEISVSHAIFIEEKVQDVVSLTSNAVLVLGRGNLYTYSIP